MIAFVAPGMGVVFQLFTVQLGEGLVE